MTDDQRTIAIVRLYADEDGESHFSDDGLTVGAAEFAPPAPPVYVSAPGDAKRFLFLVLPHGWFGDLHPAPHRQLMVMTSGTLEVTTSDGETREFHRGDIVLVEDTFGRGHATRCVDGNAIVAVVQT